MKASFFLWAGLPLASALVARSPDKCRCLPGDACWPAEAAWDTFNSTVEGRLIKTTPLGSPCHDPTYDAEACDLLKEQWELPQLHFTSSSSVMQAFWANQSCDPFLDEARPCTLGNYVSYSVNVSNAEQVAETVKFATKNNIRLVIRNTGHDYHGRSTGAGALAVWTHHMNGHEFLDWEDDLYTGPAIKVGAGILGGQAAEVANSKGLVLVSGECPTVGMAGGYTQGGGHSALSTSFGLAADQTLEFEVVTAEGNIVKASAKENSDLYWALSGGGAGNYGVVTALTVRAHYAGKAGGASLQMTVAGTTKANFDKAISRFFDLLPAMVDQDATVVYYFTNQLLKVQPITVLNSTGDFVKEKVLGPFLDVLEELEITPDVSFTTLSFRDHYDTYMGPLPYGHVAASGYQYGGRLIPRSVVEENSEEFQAALRNLTANGVIPVCSSGKFQAPKGVSNAVLPAWRESIMSMQLATTWDPLRWDDMMAIQKRITHEFVPQISAVTPGGSAYMNEGDSNQLDWQKTFYGVNYDKLLKIKQKWDPTSLFYGLKNVGSDAWNVANDGRMCRA